MAIRELSLQNYNRPISMFLEESGAARDFILDPAYQRGSVWTLEQRRNLILSILQGLPIGAVFLNDRRIGEYAVVDGKQRIETIQMWGRDEFDVPREWFEEDDLGEEVSEAANEVFYSQLSDRGRRHMMNYAVATYETHFKGEGAEAQELELFERINFGGTPQGEPGPVDPVVSGDLRWCPIRGIWQKHTGDGRGERVPMPVSPEAKERLWHLLHSPLYMGTGIGRSDWILRKVEEDEARLGEG